MEGTEGDQGGWIRTLEINRQHVYGFQIYFPIVFFLQWNSAMVDTDTLGNGKVQGAQ